MSANVESSTVTHGSSAYDPAFFERLAVVEDRHFWFVARNRVLAAVIRDLTAGWQPGYCVMEVGCGNGNVLRTLDTACPGGRVIGMDLFQDGLLVARPRTRCPLVCGDIHAAPFTRPFELIGMFDVLEHLEDDRAVLKDINRMLAPGGLFIATVPAHMSLWSYFDDCGHFRRYAEKELAAKLRDSGFELVFLTQFMSSLYPLIWAGRRLATLLHRASGESRRLSDMDLKVVPGLNGILKAALCAEIPLLRRRRRLPIGSSILAIARRPSA
jgi:SAM-dependent methyltransferase